MNIPTDYSAGAPEGYLCSKCGAHGVKLWRQYQTLASEVELLCRPCGLEDQQKTEEDVAGTDQISWLVPAVPVKEGDTFWGYTSVPAAGCSWWNRLEGKSGAERRKRRIVEEP